MIEIKTKTGFTICEYDCATIKEAVQKAVRENVSLKGVDLEYVDLKGANLTGADLEKAWLKGASLNNAWLKDANLKYAFLRNAVLRGAYLPGADFGFADLRCADLRYAELNSADLKFANFNGASLKGSALTYANLMGADCKDVDFRWVNLTGVENIPYIPLACPSDGAFVGWKKINCREADYLVKLLIPGDAKRCSGTSNKCRCNKAKVLEITNLSDGSSFSKVINTKYRNLSYEVGRMVYPDSYDEDRWNECSHGIHFFINKQDAINYK